jgi:integrase
MTACSLQGGREKPKERGLNDNEMRAVWQQLENGSTAPRRALQLIFLAGQRPGEVIGMLWDELNISEAMWTLSGTRVKNGMTHLVPLSNSP